MLINDLPTTWSHKLLTAGLIGFLLAFVRLFSDRSRYSITWRTEKFFMLPPYSLEDHLQMCLHCRQYCSWFSFLSPSGGMWSASEFHCCPPAAHREFSVMKSHLHYSLLNWHTGFEACILMQWVLQLNNCMKKYLSFCVLNLIVPLMPDPSCNLDSGAQDNRAKQLPEGDCVTGHRGRALGSALLWSLWKTCRGRKGQQVWATGAVSVHLMGENSFCFCSLSHVTSGQMTVC